MKMPRTEAARATIASVLLADSAETEFDGEFATFPPFVSKTKAALGWAAAHVS
jgi:hypothetical protein